MTTPLLARSHLADLASAGVGERVVATKSGVARSAIRKIRNGGVKRIRRETEAALLAVSVHDAAPGTTVDAGPAWRMIDEMLAAGMTRVSVARALHGPEARSLQLGRKEITVASDRAVKAFFEDWKAEQPVEEISYEDALAEERRVLALREDALSPLLKLLERRIDENSWRRHAACRGRPSNLFFPERGFGSDVVIRQAKEICGSCTARDKCLEAHMSTKTGVYGGTTPRERRALRVQRSTERSTERPTKHGMSAYAKGCRCEECRAANAAHAAKYRFPMY